MIRQLAILAIAAICLSASTPANAAAVEKSHEKAYETLYNFMLHAYEGKKFDDEIYKLGKDYDFEAKMKTFDPKYKEIVGTFLDRYKGGIMLHRGNIFSIYCPQQVEDVKVLFRVLYNAPDIWEFLYLSIWSSIHLNEYQFFYAIDAAVAHRADTKDFGVRPPYQLIPEYFFNSDVMKQVYDIKIGLNNMPENAATSTFTVLANYSNSYITDATDYEYNMTYFLEDISLSSWYYSVNQKYPFWMSGKEYEHLPIEKRGELYYHLHKWLLNRYYLERLSNNLGDVEFLDWKEPIKVGYSPYMNYPNGMQFPRRKEWTKAPFEMNNFIEELEDFESRITLAADSGFVFTKDGQLVYIRNETGFNIFANLVQGNMDSINKDLYGSVDHLGRRVLGFSAQPHNHQQMLPSALEHHLTSLRDPAFYRLSKKIDHYFLKYFQHLGPYTHEELVFDGVKINSVEIVEKNLITYFEWVDTVINKFWYSNYQHMATIKARQFRLNHKPFTYKVNINSEKDVKASIRILLGPKFNVYGKEISDNYKNFYEVDFFVKDLKKGDNIFERKSIENHLLSSHSGSGETFETTTGDDQKLASDKRRYGFPLHLLLPKGKAEGLPVQFFVYVSEFVASEQSEDDYYLSLRDNKPLGFPVERPMHKYDMPNMYRFDAEIIHKEEASINLTNQ